MTHARSINHPGRRRLKGWQVTALVGVVGALSVAGCSSSSSSTAASSSTSSSTSSSSSQQQSRGHEQRGLNDVGLDRLVGQPAERHRRQRRPDRR